MNNMRKRMEQRAKDVEKTRRLLKQFLYALHVSEGFGERRLVRVVYEWSQVYEHVNNPKNNENDEMLMIDKVLDNILPKPILSSIGYEKLLNRKGEEIK